MFFWLQTFPTSPHDHKAKEEKERSLPKHVKKAFFHKHLKAIGAKKCSSAFFDPMLRKKTNVIFCLIKSLSDFLQIFSFCPS